MFNGSIIIDIDSVVIVTIFLKRMIKKMNKYFGFNE